uniref:Uncharacterized protein n=1 Tax=Tetranychus urticae TaxID=32264 RepID=T1KF49_TETUR
MTSWSPRKMDAWIDENEEMEQDDESNTNVLGSSFNELCYPSHSPTSINVSSSQRKISTSEAKIRKSFKRSISFSTATNTSSIISRRETSKLLSPLDTSRRKLHLELTE